MGLFLEHVANTYYAAFEVVARRLDPRGDHQAIVQDVLLRLLQIRPHFYGDPIKFVKRSVARRAINARRRRFRSPVREDRDELLPTRASDSPSPGQTRALDDLKQALRDAIPLLPTEYQQLAWLRFRDELAYDDIAAILCMTRESVKNKVTKLISRLRGLLRESGPGGAPLTA